MKKRTALARAPAALVRAEPAPLAAGNPFAIYLLTQGADSSRRAIVTTLRRMLRDFYNYHGEPIDFPWASWRRLETAALRAWLIHNKAPATTKKTLSFVRGILHECYRLEQLSERDYRMAIDLPPVPGVRTEPGRHVPLGELRALFRACFDHQRPSIAARNAAIVALGYGANLRRAEIASLDVDSLAGDFSALTVLGKRNKERRIPVPQGTRDALVHWLAVRGDAPGALLYATAKSGTTLTDRRISVDTVSDVLARLAKLAGLQNVTPHDLRRSYISELLDAGADIATVAGLVGHANVETTRRYDRRGERARERASELLCVPFEAPAR